MFFSTLQNIFLHILACECNPSGSVDLNCEATTGQCNCKDHIAERKCDKLEPGYYNFTSPTGSIIYFFQR